MSWFADRGHGQGSALLERDVEILLSGRPVGNGMEELEGLLAELRTPVPVERDSPDITRLLIEAARLARKADLNPALPRVATRVRFPAWSPAAAVAAIVLVFGAVPTAVAANTAAPGDPLYVIDRALERIGVFAGGFEERIAEVEHLNDTGRHGEALTHLDASLDEVRGRLGDRQFSMAFIQLELAHSALGSEASDLVDKVRRSLGGPSTGENQGLGNGNQGSGNQGQGNQTPGSGNQGQGSGNQGTSGNQGQGSGNQGTPGNQGQGNETPGSGNQGTPGNQGQGNQNSGPGKTDAPGSDKPGRGLGRDR